MQQRTLGDRTVSAVGLGAMPMSIEGRPDEKQSFATFHAALDAGVTFIDTADAYHLHADDVGHNEELVARALRAYGADTSHILVATKGGHLRPGDGSWTVNSDPDYLKAAAKASARRLGVDVIGLYQHHRPDPQVPYADSIGAIRDLLDEGVIQRAGISNANIAQIDLANEILGGRLVSVQNQFSPVFRASQGELDHCAKLGIAFIPWSPLGGMGRAHDLGVPGYQEVFAKVGANHGVSPQQVCLAWQLALAPNVIPIPGASRSASIQDSVLAADLVLSDDEIALLNATTA